MSTIPALHTVTASLPCGQKFDVDFPPLCAPARNVPSEHTQQIKAKAEAWRAAIAKTLERAKDDARKALEHAKDDARKNMRLNRRSNATLLTAPRFTQHVVLIAKWLNSGVGNKMRPYFFDSNYSVPVSARKRMGSSGLLLKLSQKCSGVFPFLIHKILSRLQSTTAKRGAELWRELVIPGQVVFHHPRTSASTDHTLFDDGPRDSPNKEAVVGPECAYVYRTMLYPRGYGDAIGEPPHVRTTTAPHVTLTLNVPTVEIVPMGAKVRSSLSSAGAGEAHASLQKALQKLLRAGLILARASIYIIFVFHYVAQYQEGVFDDEGVEAIHQHYLLGHQSARPEHYGWFLRRLGKKQHEFFEAFADLKSYSFVSIDLWGDWFRRLSGCVATLPLPYGFKIAPCDDATLHFCRSRVAGALKADVFILSDGSLQECRRAPHRRRRSNPFCSSSSSDSQASSPANGDGDDDTNLCPWWRDWRRDDWESLDSDQYSSDPDNYDFHDPSAAYISRSDVKKLLLRATLESQGEWGHFAVREDDPNLTRRHFHIPRGCSFFCLEDE